MDSGRDEMNLAEFPLAGLANRWPMGKDTLVFEASKWDKQLRTKVLRRLTVTASAELGLPTASDDEAILGLVQLSHANGFAEQTISFIPADLFRLLGWREEGRSYSRLETSLKRLLGVTLYYDHAWWDKQRKSWVDEHFHLLDNVTVRRRPQKRAGEPRQPWSVTWNRVMFRSFRSEYIKKLDMNVYRQLRLAASKRMYRFLDKRFHYSNRLPFDLRTFACEHIGFRRQDDNSQLKRRLDRAIEELVQVGFLERLPRDVRYRRIRHGYWEVLFVRKRAIKKKKPAGRDFDPQEAALVNRGVGSSMAARLVREHADSSIRAGIDQFDELSQRGQNVALTNPPGLLVALIREQGRSVNQGDRREGVDTSQERPQTRKPTRTVSRRDIKQETQARRERDAIQAHLVSLSAEEIASLEAEALSQSTPFHAEGYRRSRLAGHEALAREYRDMIVESHVRKVLGFSSE